MARYIREIAWKDVEHGSFRKTTPTWAPRLKSLHPCALPAWRAETELAVTLLDLPIPKGLKSLGSVEIP